MKVRDIMTKDVIVVREDAPLLEVARTMSSHGFHAIPVVDSADQIAGIVTESDFFTTDLKDFYLPEYVEIMEMLREPEKLTDEHRKNLENLHRATAGDIMVHGCTTIGADDDLEILLALIREKQFNSIPVIDENRRVVGIVTTKDALLALSSPKAS